MNQEDCFTPLRHKAVELPDYIQWLLDQDIEWAEHFGFRAVPLPADFIQIEPALAGAGQGLADQKDWACFVWSQCLSTTGMWTNTVYPA